MTDEPSTSATIRAAGHPLVLGAAALIVVNDYLLRGHAPGWMTGKLSDIGWLVVTPVLVATVFTAIGVRHPRALGLTVAAVVYTALQLWPPLGAALRPDHVADLGDLLVLPALAGAIFAWRSPPRRTSEAKAPLSPRLSPAHGERRKARLRREFCSRSPPRSAAALLGIPVLVGALVADEFSPAGKVSAPCGDGMTWSPERPLMLVVVSAGGPAWDTDAFLRGVRLTEGTGADVPLVIGKTGSDRLAVCARDGLRGDTEYTWEIGPWDEFSSNEVYSERSALPTVHFRTLPGVGQPAPTPGDCVAQVTPFDLGDPGASACLRWWSNDTGGDTSETGADTGPDSGAE